ncbi:UNVERIFIED_ORG: hypothetical protein J2W74_001295 [Methylorubrum zatmanii]
MATNQQIKQHLLNLPPSPPHPHPYVFVLSDAYIDWHNGFGGDDPRDTSQPALVKDVHGWLAMNVEPSEYTQLGVRVRFANEDDAFAFKMRFK